jgi:AraC-like DNA-binding protein
MKITKDIMKKNAWFDHEIARFDLGLTRENPFLVRHWRITDAPECSYDMHYGLEMGIVLAGRVKRYYADNLTLDYLPGQVWFSGIWDLHGWRVTLTPFESVILYILPEFGSSTHFAEAPQVNLIAPFLAEPSARPIVPARKREAFLELGRKLIQTSQNRISLHQAWLRHLFIETLLHVYDFWQPPHRPNESAAGAFAQIQSAIQLVFESRCYISEKNAAKACQMNLSAFNKFFRQIIGMSFFNFALRYRINGVAMDLLGTNSPVKEIAGRWGFRYLSNMGRCFKKYYGCSPQDYRESNTKRRNKQKE